MYYVLKFLYRGIAISVDPISLDSFIHGLGLQPLVPYLKAKGTQIWRGGKAQGDHIQRRTVCLDL